MIHGLPGREAGLVIVAQQFVQEVQSLRADQVLVLAVDEALPPFTGVSGGGAENGALADTTLTSAALADAALADAMLTEAVKRRRYLPRMSLKRGSSSMLYLSM